MAGSVSMGSGRAQPKYDASLGSGQRQGDSATQSLDKEPGARDIECYIIWGGGSELVREVEWYWLDCTVIGALEPNSLKDNGLSSTLEFSHHAGIFPGKQQGCFPGWE